jgi:superfamily II DNA or RNA helicase
MTRRSLARLHAYFLGCEDPQCRLDARPVNTLAHQVSLVRHVLGTTNLSRVLIADEVGLGKTVEVGLLVQELLGRNPGLRVLYLAPARLVSNVRDEFDRLGLPFRQWTSDEGDARLNDPRIIASVHRAVHRNHFQALVQTPPWDVLVVDECHHLTDWAEGGGDPRLKYRLVEHLIARQPTEGRVVFLSGTPHQGHPYRFENLLALLRRKDEPEDAMCGRVVYRTKEDVRDWDERPLFPGRQVNEPLLVDLGADYREWLRNIHSYYRPSRADYPEEARQRAAGWRCAQALQWAASSPQAGLGFLTRQAVRSGWTLANPALRESVLALRPYRDGPHDEAAESLFARLRREVQRQKAEADLEDAEDDTGLRSPEDRDPELEGLLREGIGLIGRSGDARWDLVRDRILRPAGGEKVVLFAQPIETVTAFAGYLKRITGVEPARILGGQSDAERRRQVELFRRADGPRYLVSSRAGGEGINLQVARRLVHLDVPWNPMDMEQRVGRVHRFGSRQTVLVDTVVVKDSREADAYRVARERLKLIATTLVEPERFEAVFARVMCLVSPQELGDVIIGGARTPLTHADQDRIASLVQQGFQAWDRFHQRFAEQQRLIRHLNPGLATWGDLLSFLREHAGAEEVPDFTAQRFVWKEGQADPVAEPASVIRLGGTGPLACGDYAGTQVTGPGGQAARPLGLNVPEVAAALRERAFPALPTGASHLRWPQAVPAPSGCEFPFGVLALVRQSVRSDGQSGGWTEHATRLCVYLVQPSGRCDVVEEAAKGELLRGVLSATVRLRPEAPGPLDCHLQDAEERLIQDLRRPSESDLEQKVRHAVTPLLAAVVSPA